MERRDELRPGGDNEIGGVVVVFLRRLRRLRRPGEWAGGSSIRLVVLAAPPATAARARSAGLTSGAGVDRCGVSLFRQSRSGV
jgi:hypothetical protein